MSSLRSSRSTTSTLFTQAAVRRIGRISLPVLRPDQSRIAGQGPRRSRSVVLRRVPKINTGKRKALVLRHQRRRTGAQPDLSESAPDSRGQSYQRLRTEPGGAVATAARPRSRAPFVTKAFAMRRADGAALTQTTWTQGVPTLLPAVDVICLVEDPATPESEPVLSWMRWDVVAKACADDCWELRQDLRPPRLQTIAWPSPETLAQLRKQKLR